MTPVSGVVLLSTFHARVSSHLYGGATCWLLAVLATLGICERGALAAGAGGTIVFTVGGARMSNLTCVVDAKLTGMPDG